VLKGVGEAQRQRLSESLAIELAIAELMVREQDEPPRLITVSSHAAGAQDAAPLLFATIIFPGYSLHAFLGRPERR
jgi:hypothetical protein